MIKLINDDCLNVFKKIKDESIDLIITDPPYRVTQKGCSGTTGGMLATILNKKGKVFEYNDINISQYSKELYRILKDGAFCCIMSNHINLISMLNELTKVGFKFIKNLIWLKDNKITGRYFMSQYEYIIFLRKGSISRINNCGVSDVFNIPNKKTKNLEGKNMHNTEKPIALMEILIENCSQERDTILDPFMGIGTTGIACKKINRNFIGIELDKEYFEIAKERIERN